MNLMYKKCSPKVPVLNPTDFISVRLVLKEKAIEPFYTSKMRFHENPLDYYLILLLCANVLRRLKNMSDIFVCYLKILFVCFKD